MKNIITVSIFFVIVLYSGLVACDGSGLFREKDIREKKRFIKELIAYPDSLCELAFYEKYETFRIRNGFIEDYIDVFTDPEVTDELLPYLLQDNYDIYGKKFNHSLSQNDTVESHVIEIIGNPKQTFPVMTTPGILFVWVRKNEEWVLNQIMFKLEEGHWIGIESPSDYENW